MRRALLPVVIALVIMVIFAAGVPNASAVLITQWSYTASAGFVPASVQPASVEQLLVQAPLGLPTRLEWGTPFAPNTLQSALQLGPPQPVVGVETTNDGLSSPTVSITHENRVITGDALTSATIFARLALTPLVPPGPPLPNLDVPFNIAFFETFNVVPCFAGSVSTCDDIFILTNPGAVSASFTIDDFTYTVTQNVTGLGPLSAAACAAAGQPFPCVGVTTQEGLNNVVNTSFAITAQSTVPEPSTLLLLGSGLAGLSLYARKKVHAKV